MTEERKHLQAVGILLLAFAIVPCMDGIAKYLSAFLPVMQIAWGRFAFNAVLVVPLAVARHRETFVRPRDPWWQVGRSLCIVAATFCFFWAISSIPITDALALLFVAPLIVTALAPVVLGESVGVRRWTAVVIGFCGCLLVIRPGFGGFDWGSMPALAAGFFYALFVIATRRLSGTAPALVTQAYQALIGALVLSVTLPFVWQTPTLAQWGWLFVMGTVSAVGHLLMIMGYERGEASRLVPLSYFEVVMATIIGWTVFGDFPNAITWAGIAVIVACGIYIGRRERIRGRPSSAVDTPP